MAGGLLPQPKQMIQDSAWNPGIAYQWYTYAAGSLTPKATYQDVALTIANTNPVVANARGEMVVYGSGTYRIIAKDSLGNTLWDRDNIDALIGGAALSAADGASLVGYDDTTLDIAIKSRLKRTVSTLGELRGLSKLKYTRASAIGATAAGDGAGGEYWYDPSDSTSADNGTSVIVATDGGRWKLTTQGKNSGAFYPATGARVGRYGDRFFAGDATKHTGENDTVQADWLTTYQLARGRANGFIQSAQAAILQGANSNASNGLVVGSQTINLTDNYNTCGLISVSAANKLTGTGHAYAGYFEAYRNLSVPAGAYGIEVDTINYSSTVLTDPFQQPAGQTIGVQLAAGGEYPSAGQYPVSAAINIRNNGSTYQRGIIFGSDSLTGADATTGTAIAMLMSRGHQIVWYSAANTATSTIQCLNTTPAGGTKQSFEEYGVYWRNAGGGTVFQMEQYPGAVNFVGVRATVSGQAGQLVAGGLDANVDIQLVPKGTGVVWLGAYSAGALTQTGYITVKDVNGTVRKLMVG